MICNDDGGTENLNSGKVIPQTWCSVGYGSIGEFEMSGDWRSIETARHDDDTSV